MDNTWATPLLFPALAHGVIKQHAPRDRRVQQRRVLHHPARLQAARRRDEAEAAWVWIDAIMAGWDRQGTSLTPYAAGSWGPAGAFALTERNGHSWYE